MIKITLYHISFVPVCVYFVHDIEIGLFDSFALNSVEMLNIVDLDSWAWILITPWIATLDVSRSGKSFHKQRMFSIAEVGDDDMFMFAAIPIK